MMMPHKIRERRLEVRNLKSGPCFDCGRTYPYYVMDFDHRDPSKKIMDVPMMARYQRFTWQDILAEVAKCDLVCACCHRLRTYPSNVSYNTRRIVDLHRSIMTELKATTPCFDCGRTFKACQVDFDHVHTKNSSVPHLAGRSMEELLREMASCQLVCANCHRVRTFTDVEKNASPEHATMLVSKFLAIKARTQIPVDPRPRYGWFPMPELLGKMPDRELALKTGSRPATIGKIRRKAGIPAFTVRSPVRTPREHKPRQWHGMVGKMLDVEVARVAGVSPITVGAYRRQMGIARFSATPAWHKLVGTIPDTEVARVAGVTVKTVSMHRKRNNIPRPSSHKTEPWHALAGKTTDAEVARDVGLTSSAVGFYRRKMGIEAYRFRHKLESV
jgi:hypothetical protein